MARPTVTYEVGPTRYCECGCATLILMFDACGRERFFVRGHHTRLPEYKKHLGRKPAKN